MMTSDQIGMAHQAPHLSVSDAPKQGTFSTSTIERLAADDGLPITTRAHIKAMQDAREAASTVCVGGPGDAPGVRARPRRT
jgi:hypothetical protein